MLLQMMLFLYQARRRQAVMLLTVVAAALAGCLPEQPGQGDAEPANAVQDIATVEEQPGVGQNGDLPGPDSYEYKLLLDPELFGASRLDNAIATLDSRAREAAARAGVGYRGALNRLKKVRDVAFLDVPGECTLRKASYVLRLRTGGTQRLATLKFRSQDAIAVAAASMQPGDESAKSRYEEDIKPPDQHLSLIHI